MRLEQVEVSVEAGVAELVLDRPATRNAMTEPMGQDIRAAVDSLRAREDLRVVIVRGAGGVFSAGGDLSFIEECAAAGAFANRCRMEDFYRLFLSVRALRVPTIAAVGGPAIGAGACFALACDLRVAAADARFGFTFVKLGLHPGMGATYFLPRVVGPAAAADLLLTGRTVDAQEAARLGLVSRVVPPDRLLDEARALAAEIAAGAPIATAQTALTLRGSLERTLDEALAREAHAQSIDYGTADVAEGVAAIRERRPPRFRGR
jgi:enoyl-CoA hydratase/carnithine racemase